MRNVWCWLKNRVVFAADPQVPEMHTNEVLTVEIRGKQLWCMYTDPNCQVRRLEHEEGYAGSEEEHNRFERAFL